MDEIRIVAVDIDGTLTSNDGVVSDANQRAIELAVAQGVTVVLATGRHKEEAATFASKFNVDLAIISSCGSTAQLSKDGPNLWHHCIPVDSARSITAVADERGFELFSVVDGVAYLRQRPGESLGFSEGSALGHPTTRRVVPTNIDQVVGPPTKIWAGAEAVQTLTALIDDQLGDSTRYFLAYRGEQATSVDIVNAGASKGLALTRMAEI